MSKHNYSQYSNKKNNNNKPAVEVMQLSVADEVTAAEDVTTVSAPVEAVEVKIEQPKPETKPITGVVFNCSKLNVRVKPAPDADVICVIDANSEVKIDKTRSTSDWFKICTAAGVEGFCMRKFVNAKL